MPNIERSPEQRKHSKASERYVSVKFQYPGRIWEADIPIEYRRTGLDLESDIEIDAYLEKVFDDCNPKNWRGWRKEQQSFWAEEKPNADVTKAFFDKLATDFIWHCVGCSLPQNPNWARRIQDIKEFGFTLATHTGKLCAKCKSAKTHLMLIPIPRGGITGYESWSPAFRIRIMKLLDHYDAYEGKRCVNAYALLPDHKFPEIRWNNETKRDEIEHLTDQEIRHDFQLMTNQRNQQKREVCRSCLQSGKRGTLFGINYFYAGSANWPTNVPSKSKNAEQGCVGCGWYDMEKWRESLNAKESCNIRDAKREN